MPIFDCIIVGAGPAGSSAAYHLAKRGHSVILLEKAVFPRYKPCGGGISPAVQKWFDFDFAPAIAGQVDRVGFTWKLGDPVSVNLTTQPMWMVQREVFDKFLVDRATAQGATLQDQTTVSGIQFNGSAWQVTTNQGPIEGKYLIAADGVTGNCASWLGLKTSPTYIGMVLDLPTASQSTNTANFDFGSLKNGFIWRFPNGDRTSISAAILATPKGKPQEVQKQITNYAQAVGLDPSVGQFYEHPLRLWSQNNPLHSQNALLVGDAAGITDPLLAEGIRPAIYTGVKAAEAIANAIAGDSSALPEYSSIVQQAWGEEYIWAQRLSGLFFKLPGVAYKVGVKRPTAAQIMSEILCGQTRYTDITEKAMDTLKRSFLPGFG
ncbi:MAG: geranylgeranyl reductase family protein [Jaaginema sp. PMC 1079.18]|nr:geranylgeranyl reductase family protein [Jaaginema sp. PMC 1080.18]MEC4851846.1 geranylgeranyl reductase family protein [Jaaginema sp. PMC 1079.18]MEC4864492.1 geranylgeranyl reductase family protein [Jaaginema sp. PMC 1078.18]